MRVTHKISHSFILVSRWIWMAFAFFIGISLHAEPAAEPLHVAIVNPPVMNEADPSFYFEKLLVLALEKTRATDGDFVIDHKPNAGGAERVRAILISSAGLDVMWGSVNAERKKNLLVIPVNLLRGLNDYRILLIHKDDQAKFAAVQNLADLQKFVAGSGLHWNDTQVMRANNIRVITSANYQPLFKMLAAHRFNFITCGLHEINYALANFGHLGLAVESHLLLHYDKPTLYTFFVNKNNRQLADRIERGLLLAAADGSFDRVFNEFPNFKQRMAEINNPDRLKIDIQNTGED